MKTTLLIAAIAVTVASPAWAINILNGHSPNGAAFNGIMNGLELNGTAGAHGVKPDVSGITLPGGERVSR
ncbi:hypothetical protein [Roseococcus sp. YIM B11640]|uniref:hypothetical protein n=1 Tax=Roseococcus sp. YIM B11640 TaxID=3133973 RepID=UPI003C7D51DD